MRCFRSSAIVGVVLTVVAARAGGVLHAQDTARGVRIGLRYDPGTKPGIAVLPISGDNGDSIRTILERDFDYSDRLAVIRLTAADGVQLIDRTPSGAPVPFNYALFAKLGAAAALQITPTPRGLHYTLHDIARGQVAKVEEFVLPKPDLSREWRQAVH